MLNTFLLKSLGNPKEIGKFVLFVSKVASFAQKLHKASDLTCKCCVTVFQKWSTTYLQCLLPNLIGIGVRPYWHKQENYAFLETRVNEQR